MRKIVFLLFIISILVLVGCENTEPVACPEIDTPEKFFPVIGSELISLDASRITISDSYKIAPSEKQLNPFTDYGEVICHKGKEAGENVDNIYCEQLMMQKLVTNEDGDILEEKIVGIEFVFDKDHKLTEKKCYK